MLIYSNFSGPDLSFFLLLVVELRIYFAKCLTNVCNCVSYSVAMWNKLKNFAMQINNCLALYTYQSTNWLKDYQVYRGKKVRHILHILTLHKTIH